MSQFLESIKLENGQTFHLEWHQKRVNQTFQKVWGCPSTIQLQKIIQEKKNPSRGLFKIRIIYDKCAYSVEIQPYQKRKLNSIEWVETDDDYPLKSTDRIFLQNALQKSKADEVVFCKNGYITDSSYANIVLFDGKKWFTPTTFLLNGTTRQRLLYEREIHELPIHKNQIHQFQKIGFINALNGLGEQIIDIKNL